VANDGFKIIVVDDDPIAREVVSSILSREGYAVISAKDGFEAIDLLRKDNYDLLITDLVMPGIDGIELIKSALKINPDLATVIITAFGTLDSALKAIDFGAYDYITKPFKIEEVLFLVVRCKKMINLQRENKNLKTVLAYLLKGAFDLEKLPPDILDKIEHSGILTEAEVKLYKKKMENGYGQA
jgi:DNA-binding NtrC family response regulator